MNHSRELSIRDIRQPGVRRDFIQFPYRLYQTNPNWVPPLVWEEKRTFDPRRHGFLKKNPVDFFVCYHDQVPVGRIAAIINRDHNRFHNDRTAFFGFFEAIDNSDVARLLFETAAAWARNQGADTLRGPTNYSLNDIAGLLLQGFDDPPFVMMPYNPPYYERLYQENGLNVAMRFYTYEVTQETIQFPRFIEKIEERLNDAEITIRPVDLNQLEYELNIVLGIFNNSWSDNWGFVPFSVDEAITEFKKIKSFLIEDLVLIAEHKGKPAGFILALPDFYQALKPLNGRLFPFNWIKLIRNMKRIGQIRVVLMGVEKEFRNKGIDLVLYKKIFDNSIKKNYKKAELSWILENNTMMNRVLEHINAKKNKVYAIFEKRLAD